MLFSRSVACLPIAERSFLPALSISVARVVDTGSLLYNCIPECVSAPSSYKCAQTVGIAMATLTGEREKRKSKPSDAIGGSPVLRGARGLGRGRPGSEGSKVN